jgi:hypothetical protein
MENVTTQPAAGGNRDRFIRRQKIAMDQLSYAQNLVLTFTVAALGYWFGVLKDKDFIPGSSAKSAMLLSLFFLSVSAICGPACVLTRLHDFRGTALLGLQQDQFGAQRFQRLLQLQQTVRAPVRSPLRPCFSSSKAASNARLAPKVDTEPFRLCAWCSRALASLRPRRS